MEDVNNISGPCTRNSNSYIDKGCCLSVMFLCASKKNQAMENQNASEVLGYLHGTPGSDEIDSVAACSAIHRAYDQNVHGLPTGPT